MMFLPFEKLPYRLKTFNSRFKFNQVMHEYLSIYLNQLIISNQKTAFSFKRPLTFLAAMKKKTFHEMCH